MMKANTITVLEYLKTVNGKDVTAEDIAAATGLTPRQVVGSFNSFVRKGWGVRTEAEVEMEDGTTKILKFLALTEDGMAVDPNAAPASAE